MVGRAIPTSCAGGCTFAENPGLDARHARIIWHADLDPGTLKVLAVPALRTDPDAVDPGRLARWLAIATDAHGIEHAVLSDGRHHIRLDVEQGSLAAQTPVVLHYRLWGLANPAAKLLPLRRLLHLCRYRRFAASLFPEERRMARWLSLLRVQDALDAGATQREIATAFFGEKRIDRSWRIHADSLRSRVRRMIREARSLARGGYRMLMRDSRPNR